MHAHRQKPAGFARSERGTSLNGFTDAANFLQGILAAAAQVRFGAGSCAGQPPSPNPVFAPATLGADFFPNPQTTYLETPGFCFQSGKMLVVTGRAPVFPDTYNGQTVFDPAPPFEGAPVQLRYWSMCNNDRVIPYPVVACKADFETAIKKMADPNTNSPVFTYTYIVSADPAPPDLPENINWLPWGATDIPKNLIFRIILPGDSFILTDYYPQAVFCDRANLADLSACFPASARISSAAGSH